MLYTECITLIWEIKKKKKSALYMMSNLICVHMTTVFHTDLLFMST